MIFLIAGVLLAIGGYAAVTLVGGMRSPQPVGGSLANPPNPAPLPKVNTGGSKMGTRSGAFQQSRTGAFNDLSPKMRIAAERRAQRDPEGAQQIAERWRSSRDNAIASIEAKRIAQKEEARGIEAALAKKFEDLGTEAASKALSEINDELGLDLKVDDGFAAIAESIVAKAGSEGGTAAGNAICGPPCGLVAGKAGEYLAGKINKYVDWEEVGDWISSKAEDAWDWGVETVTGWFD